MKKTTVLKVFVALLVVATLVVGLRVGAEAFGVGDSEVALDVSAGDMSTQGCEPSAWCASGLQTYDLQCC
ncbi:MAG: hypothetical protein ACOC32_01775 [Nanoarchaeota archaeon]